MRYRGLRAAVAVALAFAVGAAVVGVSSAAPTFPTPPKTVKANRLHGRHGQLKRGTVVANSELGIRVFSSSKNGFSLATTPSNETYPASTVDGGKLWRINGPVFHIPAADAPQVVTEVGVAGARTYFAWGGPFGGNAVNVTSDAGKIWYQAFLGEAVLSVVKSFHHRLIAFAQALSNNSNSRQAETWVYVSRDGGRVWHYNSNINGS